MTSPTNQGHIKTKSGLAARRSRSHREEDPSRGPRGNFEPSRGAPRSESETTRHTMHPTVPCLGGTFSMHKLSKPRGCSSSGPPAVDFGTASPCGRPPVRRPGGDRRTSRNRCLFVQKVPHSGRVIDDVGVKAKEQPTAGTFFTERTLAAYLAVSDRTIRNWIRRGELPSYKLGASRRIDPADVEDFLARHRDEEA